MIPLNYHHLYYFWVAAKAGSMTEAKRKLMLAQPTISLQIQQLEKTLGKKLLHRHRDGVTLTSDGRIAFEHCERIFKEGEALAAAFGDGASRQVPVLRLGVAEPVSREILLLLLDRIQELAPQARTAILSAPSGSLVDALRRHTVDLAVADADYSAMLGREFRGRLAGEIPIQFVAEPRLARRLKGLKEIPMLLRTPDNQIRKDVESLLAWRGLSAAVAAETDDPELIRILAIQGKGVAALNSLAVRKDLAEGRLALLDKKPSGIKSRVWLIGGVHAHSHPVLRAVVEPLLSGFTIG